MEPRDPHKTNREYIASRFNGDARRALDVYNRTVEELERSATVTKYIPLLALRAALDSARQ